MSHQDQVSALADDPVAHMAAELKKKAGGDWMIDLSKQRDGHKTSRFYGPFAARLPDELTPVLDAYAHELAMDFGGDEEEKEIYEGARLQHLAAQDKVRQALDEPPRLRSARLHRDGLSRRMCAAYGCALLVLAFCVVVFLFWLSAKDDDDDDDGGSIVSGSGLLDANATLLVAFSQTPAVVTASGSGCAVAYAVGESAVTLTGDAAGDTAYLCQPGDEVSYALVP